MDEAYIDAKGRTRWRSNDEIAARLKQLGDYLVIGGYDETHAARYGRLAYTLSRCPEPVERLYAEHRLTELPDIGPTIAGIIGELIATGTCAKMDEWSRHTPKSVLELTTIPGLGAKTIRALYQAHGIDSLNALRQALERGQLTSVAGLGPKTLAALRQWLQHEKQMEIV